MIKPETTNRLMKFNALAFLALSAYSAGTAVEEHSQIASADSVTEAQAIEQERDLHKYLAIGLGVASVLVGAGGLMGRDYVVQQHGTSAETTTGAGPAPDPQVTDIPRQ